MTFVLIVTVAVLALMVFSLRERVSELEWKLKNTQTKQPETKPSLPNTELVKPKKEPHFSPVTSSADRTPVIPKDTIFTPQTVAKSTPPRSARVEIPMASSRRATPSSVNLIAWIKDGFFVKVGALLFFLGVGLFVSYAFNNNWVSPEMRIVIGFVIAAVVYAVGMWRMRTVLVHGLALNALGTAIVMATVFAAQFAYNLFNPTFALILMALAVASSTALAMRHQTEWLAIAAAVAGLIVPFLTNVPEPSLVGFLSYLMVLTLSFVWVVHKTGWARIIAVLLLGVELLLLNVYTLFQTADDGTVLLFAGGFALVFYGAGIMSSLTRRTPHSLDLFIAGVNALWLLYWIYMLVPEALQALIAFLVAALAAVTSYWLRANNRATPIAYLHAGIGLVYGFVATAYLFSGYTLTLALTVETAFILAAAMRYAFRPEVVYRLGMLGVLPVLASVSSFESAVWSGGWMHADMYALSILTVALLGLSIFAYRQRYQPVGNVTAIMAWVYATAVTFHAVNAVTTTDQFMVWAGGILAIITALLICVWIHLRLPALIRNFFACAFVVPVVLSLGVIDNPLWETGWWHSACVSLMSIGLVSLAVCVVSHLKGYRMLRDIFALVTLWYFVLLPWLVLNVVWSEAVARHILALWYTGYVMAGLCIALSRQSRQVVFGLLGASAFVPFSLSVFVITTNFWQAGVMHSAFVALGGITLLTGVLALYAAYQERYVGVVSTIRRARDLAAWISGFYGVTLVWLTTHALFSNESTAVSISLFIYVVVGVGLYIGGRVHNVQLLRAGGMVLLVGVVLRLVIIDVWTLEMTWRVLTFAGIGILFLGTSFIETNLKNTQPDNVQE